MTVSNGGKIAACLFVAGLALPGSVRAAFQLAADADELYRHRDNIADAKQAADMWAAHAATDYPSAWKLARACYWIGTTGPDGDRRAALLRGIGAAKTATTLAPNRADGHFWLAADMGAMAEQGGVMQGLKYRGDIKSELEHVIAIQPDWQDGSAESALGRWYFEVPSWGFGGSHSKAKDLLRGVIARHPDNQTALSFLADVLLDEGKKDEAVALLQRVIAAPVDPDWIPEHDDYVAKAAARLRNLTKR